MEKIKFIVDTACDIPDEHLAEYASIQLLSFPITVDATEYFERKSFSIEEFYDVLGNAKEIPITSRIPLTDYISSFQKAWEEGYTHIIAVTINATGSGTYTSALMSRDMFFEQNPQAKGSLEIHAVDSRTYTMAYGYPVVESAKMALEGVSCTEILDYLEDWFDSVEVYLGCYTLEHAKKSGRIGAAAAFVGDVLGLRPVILMVDGQTKIIDKVRGDRNLAKQLFAHYLQNRTGKDSPVLIARGQPGEPVDELQKMFLEDLGREVPVYRAGAAIVINSGAKIAAIVSKGKRRHPKK